MCYEASQLAEKIYREAIRIGASDADIQRLKLKWESLKEVHKNYYHSTGFSHEQFAVFTHYEKLNLELCNWGLIPSWVKTELKAEEIRNKTINARGETIFEKPSFKISALKNRCILPLNGFYEHHHRNGKTYPYFIEKKDKKRLLIGGITNSWINEQTGEIINTFSIVTTKGNSALAKIHNNPKLNEPRMPLILDEINCKQWLSGNKNEATQLIKTNHKIELNTHTVRRLKGRDYLGNIKSAQDEYSHPELLHPPSLFD